MTAGGDTGSALALMFVFACILCWSGVHMLWISSGKSRKERTELRETLTAVAVIIAIMSVVGLVSGPGPFESFLAIMIATPVFWTSSYLLSKHHKKYWDNKMQRLKSTISSKKGRKD
jgi:uncharacterized membrane protein YfcA